MAAATALGRRAEREKVRAELDAYRAAMRGQDVGGTIDDMAAERVKRAVARAWQSYVPETTASDILEARAELPDMRPVPIGRVYAIDLPAAIRRYCGKRGKDERETLRTDALLLIARWTEQGTGDNRVKLGAAGDMPPRCAWTERDENGRLILTAAAWRVMRAALLQSQESREIRAAELAADMEALTEPEPLGRIAERESMADPAPRILPDIDAPDILAAAMDLPLDAARALILRAYQSGDAASARGGYVAADAAADWGISPGRVRKVVSDGARILLERYPDPADLLQAAADAAPRYRAMTTERAELALDALRSYPSPDALRRAERAAREYLSAHGTGDPETLALESAARRHGASPERAERIALSVRRILPAERARARARIGYVRSANYGSGGSSARPCPTRAALQRVYVRAAAVSYCAQRGKLSPARRAEILERTRYVMRETRKLYAQRFPTERYGRAERIARETLTAEMMAAAQRCECGQHGA